MTTRYWADDQQVIEAKNQPGFSPESNGARDEINVINQLKGDHAKDNNLYLFHSL
jgi:hypothetical protein